MAKLGFGIEITHWRSVGVKSGIRVGAARLKLADEFDFERRTQFLAIDPGAAERQIFKNDRLKTAKIFFEHAYGSKSKF